jgi:hypothetical protein
VTRTPTRIPVAISGLRSGHEGRRGTEPRMGRRNDRKKKVCHPICHNDPDGAEKHQEFTWPLLLKLFRCGRHSESVRRENGAQA